MKYFTKKQKIDHLLELIRKEHTGNSYDLCQNICVSRPTLMRYLADMRETGYLIGYCRYRASYCFIEEKNNSGLSEN